LLIIETAFSDREKALARRSLHLAPSTLAEELDQIDRGQRYPIYITHTKPAETGLIMDEIQRFDQTPSRVDDVRHDIRWLSAGQTFEL
ncbi:MAG: 3',5'-cyclic-nucleotide phosphodiesterase, partial [Hydrogenophaga sp.]|nr:3',5'-cyclic-nucleotide phosphodiesterase [Hydrogenophaga sp.]